MASARALLLLAALCSARGAGPGPPQFSHTIYNVSIPENSPPRTFADQPAGTAAFGLRLPVHGTRVRARIRHGDRDKLFKLEEQVVGDFCFLSVRTRAGHTAVLNRERRDHYMLAVRATATSPDGSQFEADTLVAVTVSDENDLSPLFYPTEYEVYVAEDAPLHSSVLRVTAEDADLGINGEIYYSLAEHTEIFAIHPTSGVLTVTRSLSFAEKTRHDIDVLAHDRASLLSLGEKAPAARASVIVNVKQANLYAPELSVRKLPELIENSTTETYAIIEVTDRDVGEHGRIAYLDIVDGDPDGHFRIRPSLQPGQYDLVVHALLDRESAPQGYNVTLRATDAGQPPRSSYLTLPITLTDVNDNAPVFSREVYEASIPETAPPNTPVIRLKVTDRDEGQNALVYIEIVGGNEGGEFIVNPDTGVLYTVVPLDAEEKFLYTLTVSAIDHGNAGTRKQSSAKVKISILDANDNDPVFEKDEMEVTIVENEPSGAIVARVVARDADSGENAYISYSIANLQPVPFEVDHFSGAVRTTRLLDYESMRREYTLQIRASDWGLPYRRQAEMRLTIRLKDVNDNRPQFERVDCVGYLPRRLAIGHEIVTLSAIDFDSGDAVSYRVVGGNEDNCFSLDTTTGILSLSCDLSDIRTETRILNVTATDGTHFADAASLTLHLVAGNTVSGSADLSSLECRDTGVARRLTDVLAAAERSNAPIDFAEDFPLASSRFGENLHFPEFVDFPIEIKVNESVALGTSLVRLHARDRDLGYNGLLVFAISGGDADSAFRIDPDTGELKVIGYLDRERENEYYLNISVYDLGVPQRSSSRLLPVTVLDVNDNAPRFEKTLASFRVTENAINGTAIFRANATDRDSGDFGKVRYSISSGSDGEFCVDAESGVVMVCAALDRERRAVYELTLRAVDGGGLAAEAAVRVTVDDVNDVAPRFALASYSARVREDVPVGSVVAVLEAFDPDLGAGGRLVYSLPDQGADDIVFTVDSASGTLRTARRLDYEERQVYGVTVRATDGGQPALWAEATLIIEVADVDENAYTPTFSSRLALEAKVKEDAGPGTRVLSAAAHDADPPGRDSRLAYYILAGSGMPHFSIDDAGVIRTASPLDRETAAEYWLTVCAQDHGLVPRHACVYVYIEVEDVNDMAPWPEHAEYRVRLPENSPAGTHVVKVTAHDTDAAPRPPHLRYSIRAGNPDGLFSIDEDTGVIVTTGRALDREAAAMHALEVSVSDGELSGTARVRISLTDINDHAPAFTQRFYDVRVPPHAFTQRDAPSFDASAEADIDTDAEDDEEGSGTRLSWDSWDEEPSDDYIYVTTVTALDDDAAENGTVRYSWRARGGARDALRLHSRSGRLYAAPDLHLGPHLAYDVTVRACDSALRPRCGVARVRVRGAVRAGGGAPPTLRPPPPLQAAELDAPGFLLALLQASDPDGDPLYYDIIDGDPDHDFVVGREDGSVVLARRLLWERCANYRLNVSVTDGVHTVFAVLHVSVVNDANEGGVDFARDLWELEVSEASRPGIALATLTARAGTDERLLYGIHAARAPASLALFRLHELSGVLELAAPLDREAAALHELTVWARDQAPRASLAFARVTIRVAGADEHAPSWGRRLWEARVARGAAAGTLIAPLRAAERDAGGASPVYSLAGTGEAAGLFTVDADLGDVRLVRPLPALGPREYTLQVRAAGPPPAERASTVPLHVLVVDPDDAPPRFATTEVRCEVAEDAARGTLVATLEARSPTGVRYALAGGDGHFRLNPAAGLLTLAAPLDYEQQSIYNLTVTALNMGGGSAEARVTVHVIDRNEFPPVFTRTRYRGVVSEASEPGALVWDSAGRAPLVLTTSDGDSPANRQRAFEIRDASAARLFHVDPLTGALRLAASLDYETAQIHRFTVKVVDMGNPRVPSDSVAHVTVDVTNVNDCPPSFSQPSYEATVLLPSVKGVAILSLAATDADGPGLLRFDVIEGDARAFSLSAGGQLAVAEPAALVAGAEHHLRVRVSDGELSSTARLLVKVREPDNSGLAFQKTDYYASIMENSTKPVTIAVLDVLGAALNEHIEFTILNPTEGFEVGRTSGAVRGTGLALDREQRASYVLLVQAAGVGRVARARLTVAVTDVNDNCPVFVRRPYVAAVLAGAEPGTEVLTVEAVDADANDNGEVRYEMKRGHGELFRVDRRTGQITLKQSVDAQRQQYTLLIGAFDGGVPACAAETEVTVHVWPGGAAPRWERAHVSLDVREDIAPGVPLGPPLRALSPLARQLIYTLHAPSGADADLDLFEIHFETARDGGTSPCTLSARGALDYELAQSHELRVRATDGVSGAWAEVAVTLTVLDVNDCAPEFERDEYHAAVLESSAPGDLVINVRADDHDTGANSEVQYSLSGLLGEAVSQFVVNASSGAVRVAAPLDAELVAHHHLLLTATDGGRPALLTTAHLFITVEDVNDCAPRMERAVVTALVSEEAARGTAVGRVAAWDPDESDAARLRYAMQGAERGLKVDPLTGVLSLVEPTAFNASSARSLNVSVTDGARAAFARVKLTPAPANRNPPHFPHLIHEARALENQSPPLLLTTVKAYDEDGGEYGSVTYSIPSGKLRETFSIDAASGALSARVPLDREARAEWDVPVLAADGGGRIRQTSVRVRVLDVNDNAPEFPLREYRASVRADRSPLAPFLTLSARDADAPEHARLEYSLYERGSEAEVTGLFAVDPLTGALAFARNASGFAGRSVQVWVVARDGGGLTGEVGVQVALLASGDSAPRLAQPPPDLFLPEDATPGTLIAQLRAPSGPLPRLRLAPTARADERLFTLDSDGRLLLAAPLDRETAQDHIIGIIAEGEGSPAPGTLVQTRLHVLDVNEHAPQFHSQPYMLHLAENTPPHTSLIQLMADDPDAGSNGEVRFSLESSEEVPFAVEAGGWVRVTGPLDRESRAEYRLPLRASDQGAQPRSAKGELIVRLLDYNDCPPVFTQEVYEAEVREDAAAGTVVVRLAVRDADITAGTLAYFVAEGDIRARFQIRGSGELFVARSLDRETEAAYTLRVAATDGKFTAYATVRVSVLDVDDNPPYCLRHRLRARLPEDAPPGTRVAELLTRDADEPHNARLRFFLTGEHAEHFAIDKETGVVTVAAALDRETVARYELRAQAQTRDRPEWGCGAELQLALDDVNDNAPRFAAPLYSVTLPEDAALGTLVAKIHATDADLGENSSVRYSFIEENEFFELVPETGVVTLRATLDRETQAEVRAVVRAVDGGRPQLSATATLRLTVADVNDNPPEFELRQYAAAVPELDAPGTQLLRVRATSRDAGVNADVYYALVAGDGRDDFTLDRTTGVLSVARPLDYERRREYFLTVQAVDGGAPPLSDHATLNITILDGNDNAPSFSQSSYTARVREDAAPGTRVLQLIADDADAADNGRISYSIARGGEGHFAIDLDTGYLSVLAQLDRETTSHYVLEVRATDRGIPALESTATVDIEVMDANDNPPLFAQNNYSAVVQEDKSLGHPILKFVVSDADASPNGAPYTFDIQTGNEMGAFRIEQDGYLRSATRFNHRIKDRYILQVRVFDNGTPPLFSDAWAYIQIIEESQHPPVVTPLEVVVNSYLDEFPGGVIGRVFASDRDAYDSLRYSLASPNGAPFPLAGLFDVDAADGTLRAAPRLDVGDYRINATVDDGKFRGFAIVKVSIVLISDEMLAQAVVVRFREVTDVDFILSHRKGFIRAVREATDCGPGDVIILSVQPAEDGGRRQKRQVAQDLDVAFAVREPGGDGLLAADALRRRLHAHLERLEERSRLVVEELLRATCGGCVHGVCVERLHLRAARLRVVAADVFALVAPAHELRGECTCAAGYTGERCEAIAAEVTSSIPSDDSAVAVLQLGGDGYLAYRVERGVVEGARLLDDELVLSLRLRTRAPRGTLLWAGGRVDFLILEVVEGTIQARWELGAGEARLRAGGTVADGAWHEVRLERRGAVARLTVDRRSAQARSPPPAAVLDVRADRLLLGAALQRHVHALAPEQVTYGFHGCISDLKVGGWRLPLEEGGTSRDGRVQLVRSVRAKVAPTCAPLPPPGACAAQPCQHGGTCREVSSGYTCDCHARYVGRDCELDTDPCASQPCLHGGLCSPESDVAGGASFRCACAAGLEGARCERGRWCAEGVCAHGGACEEGEWGPSCRCRGYYGPRCQYDVDECAGEPCLNGATCLNEPGSFRCLCPPDKTGMNCGNPLYSDAVTAGEAGSVDGRRALVAAWHWVLDARWPLGAVGAVVALALLCGVVGCVRARRTRPPPPPLNSALEKPPVTKLSNLEAVRRERPASCAAPLNNLETLRSYGSAGDELEGLPPDYRRNLNLNVDLDRKPWSEQMHLHTFVDNKIYNDLKNCKPRVRAPSPASTRRVAVGAAVAGMGGDLVGGYHWDCSDWCGGGALPGISEVPGSERLDSSEPPSPLRSPQPPLPPLPPLPLDTDSAPEDFESHPFTDASSYLLGEELGLTSEGEGLEGGGECVTRVRRETDAHSLITMLEERHSLLGAGGGSGSELSAHLCEFEDSDAEEGSPRHTAV
ncbi:fat-like cadherin-related tumor suppressor homolog isoform X1 [Pieris napi]|uniref:fat-like cadherin-related tumor suppressor homolog isoform X1 n=1 Tax=Pieris napi TaxID=78633 RepID=UPI001FBB05D7|nr:fat-like cadherin-related tumor suppressor homolog isoform X1 [Pieris napi]